MNEALAAEVSANPWKKSRKGIEPPIKPIAANRNQSRKTSFLNAPHSPAPAMTPRSRPATIVLRSQVKRTGSKSFRPSLLTKIAIPEMIAVAATKMIPFFSIIATLLLRRDNSILVGIISMMDGLLRAGRYAFGPNRLHYCGPDANAEILAHIREGVADPGLAKLLSAFQTMYPSLLHIAHANDIKDPFNERVVEAYWVGNELLENISQKQFYRHLREGLRLKDRLGGKAFDRPPPQTR